MAESVTNRGPAGDGQRRCTYCFQELNEMTDPRQLPCTHIVCLPCLENDWKPSELQCRACSKEVSVDKVENLTKVSMSRDNEATVEVLPSKKFNCDICDVCADAVIYCIDCGKKCCSAHKQSHQHFFGDSHKMMDINTYAQRPALYAQVKCNRHKQNAVQYICKRCDVICCSVCPAELGPCKPGGAHELRTLQETMSDIQAEFDPLLTKCSERITKLCKLEKETWETVDSITEKCEAMKKQVDDTTEEQICEIRKRANELKAQIEKYKEDRLRNVETYVAKVIESAELFEQKQVTTQIYLQNTHVTDVVKARVEMMRELDGLLTGNIDQWKMDADQKMEEKRLCPLSKCRDVEYFLAPTVAVPKSLQHIKDLNVDIGTFCRAVHHTKNGDLIVGSSYSIALYYGNFTKFYSNGGKSSNVHSVMHKNDGTMLAFLCNGTLLTLSPSLEQRGQTATGRGGYNRSALSGNILAVCGPNITGMKLFNIQTTNSRSYSIPGSGVIRSVCSHPDEDICLLDSQNSKVCKYRVYEEKGFQLIWECWGVEKGYAICCDHQGLIYVSAAGKKLYVINSGMIVNTLTCNALPEHYEESNEYSDISVYKDSLLSTQFESLTLKVFKLNQD